MPSLDGWTIPSFRQRKFRRYLDIHEGWLKTDLGSGLELWSHILFDHVWSICKAPWLRGIPSAVISTVQQPDPAVCIFSTISIAHLYWKMAHLQWIYPLNMVIYYELLDDWETLFVAPTGSPLNIGIWWILGTPSLLLLSLPPFTTGWHINQSPLVESPPPNSKITGVMVGALLAAWRAKVPNGLDDILYMIPVPEAHSIHRPRQTYWDSFRIGFTSATGVMTTRHWHLRAGPIIGLNGCLCVCVCGTESFEVFGGNEHKTVGVSPKSPSNFHYWRFGTVNPVSTHMGSRNRIPYLSVVFHQSSPVIGSQRFTLW